MKDLNKEPRNFLMKRLSPRFMLLLAMAAVPQPSCAVIPQSINYQGFLLSKATNLPVETPQDINFVIYGAATGGSALFTESRCDVAVNKGRYDVEIGAAGGGIPGSVLIDNQNLWLEIQVDPNGDCTAPYEAMAPRIRLQAAPFAFNALYASTASAAAPVFAANIISALPQTDNGAVTISTNLFVQGNISVGSLSTGQKLAVTGMVESKGNYPACGAGNACGFKFPDGTVQLSAAVANTMWESLGANVNNMNAGNVGIGEYSNPPLARLHVSSASGETGNLLLVSTGTSSIFRVNGLGQVYGGSYYGNGATLTGIVAKTGDTMTGQLTLTSALGASTPKVKFLDNVEISSTTAANYGGVYISTHVRLSPGSVIYGDGSGLSGVVSADSTKVLKTGDTMTGQLTLAASTLTVTGNAFSVGGSTFSVLNGNTALGAASYLARLTVSGGIVATSSITAQAGIYATSINGQSVTASTASFLGWSAASNYSIDTASSIKVNAGAVIAPSFIGDGSQLTNVVGVDPSRVLKAGDTMTGYLMVSPSSVTILSMGAHAYALTVASSPSPDSYILAVTTAGRVGVGVPVPLVPLEVNNSMMVSNWGGADSLAHIYSNGGYGYLRWSDNGLSGSGNTSQGAMGFLPGATRSFVYRALGTSPGASGAEVFRIALDASDVSSGDSWRFGIGTSDPLEKFHVASNMLVSTAALAPILYISTTTGLVGVGSSTPGHKLLVNGGIMAVSSITAQGGFFGDGSGLTNISAGGLPGQIQVSSIAARADSAYGAVVFTSDTYINAKLAVGEIFTPDSDLHVRGTMRLDQKNAGDPVFLNISPQNGGSTYVSWNDVADATRRGALGILANESDLAYWAGSPTPGIGAESFRVKRDGKFLMGGAGKDFIPLARFHVVSDMMISTDAATPIFFVSTASGSVGISTGTAMERMHVASSFLVGPGRDNAILYVSTGTSFTGIGTGNPRAMLEVGNGSILGAGTHAASMVPPVTGAGSRFMWIPSASAIRAGYVPGTEWDTVGLYSVAFGNKNTVTADEAVVSGGFFNNASGRYSAIAGGYGNTNQGLRSNISGGDNNYIFGRNSVVPGGGYNVVHSSYSFVGGFNSYLDTDAQGTFVWGYDDSGPHGLSTAKLSAYRIATPYAFLIDPDDVKHYKVGVRTAAPQAALDVNGDAQFGSGLTKSTFTAEGFWMPRWEPIGNIDTIAPSAVGQIIGNSSSMNLCVSTGTTPGAWVAVGSSGVLHCY
ncbi:MAG TPA: hypothetical protein DCS63_08280 [Elusimicrobia bacterium]|nr:hypothetical protein [Elusimicrobiota bacterium]